MSDIINNLFSLDMDEALQTIFLDLDPSSLKSCSQVCKCWHNFIHSRIWQNAKSRNILKRRLQRRWLESEPSCRLLQEAGKVGLMAADDDVIVCSSFLSKTNMHCLHMYLLSTGQKLITFDTKHLNQSNRIVCLDVGGGIVVGGIHHEDDNTFSWRVWSKDAPDVKYVSPPYLLGWSYNFKAKIIIKGSFILRHLVSAPTHFGSIMDFALEETQTKCASVFKYEDGNVSPMVSLLRIVAADFDGKYVASICAPEVGNKEVALWQLGHSMTDGNYVGNITPQTTIGEQIVLVYPHVIIPAENIRRNIIIFDMVEEIQVRSVEVGKGLIGKHLMSLVGSNDIPVQLHSNGSILCVAFGTPKGVRIVELVSVEDVTGGGEKNNKLEEVAGGPEMNNMIEREMKSNMLECVTDTRYLLHTGREMNNMIEEVSINKTSVVTRCNNLGMSPDGSFTTSQQIQIRSFWK